MTEVIIATLASLGVRFLFIKIIKRYAVSLIEVALWVRVIHIKDLSNIDELGNQNLWMEIYLKFARL